MGYKFDVAFSFLKEDEELVTKLNDLIQSRLSTFLYSKKQDEIVGTDGEKTFNQVFGSESRIVVVLYRQKWGTTPWTRIEETAIRNRAFETGYDFTIFIPLETPPILPPWLPKTRIWTDLDRLGVEGAVSIIEDRVKAAGGIPHEETVEEHAARLKKQIEQEKQRKKFLDSTEGVKSSREEFIRLTNQVDQIIEKLRSELGFDLVSRHDINTGAFQWLEIHDGKFCLCAEWLSQFTNTLSDSRLDITLLKGFPRRPNRFLLEDPVKLQHLLFNFDLNQVQIPGWRNTSDSKFMTTQRMAEFFVNFFIDHIYKHELSNADKS
jgi:hypothetical protein